MGVPWGQAVNWLHRGHSVKRETWPAGRFLVIRVDDDGEYILKMSDGKNEWEYNDDPMTEMYDEKSQEDWVRDCCDSMYSCENPR